MNVTRKVRPGAKLKTLPQEKQSELLEFLERNTYDQAVEWLALQDVTTSRTALHEFRAWCREQEREAENKRILEEKIRQFTEENPDVSDEKLYQFGQRFFAELAVKQKDSLAWARTHLLEQRRQKFVLEVARFQYEQCELILKMAQDQRTQAIAESPVSYTEKLQEVGKLMYGKDWK